MNAYVGNGWRITHLADQVIELHKDSYEYRKFTGSDGVVRVRGEKGLDRAILIERALATANRTDQELAKRVVEADIPTAEEYAEFQINTRAVAKANHTGEESFSIGVKRV